MRPRGGGGGGSRRGLGWLRARQGGGRSPGNFTPPLSPILCGANTSRGSLLTSGPPSLPKRPPPQPAAAGGTLAFEGAAWNGSTMALIAAARAHCELGLAQTFYDTLQVGAFLGDRVFGKDRMRSI